MVQPAIDLARHGIELHTWPQRRPSERSPVDGVLALHKPTGFAVRVEEGDDYGTNRALAVERLLHLLSVKAIFSQPTPRLANVPGERERHGARGRK